MSAKTTKKSSKKTSRTTSKKTVKKSPAKESTRSSSAPKTAKDAIATLKRLGTAQNRKVYARHGVTGEQFGVSFGALRPLAKGIGRDHAMAVELWKSGNHDARLLATMIAEPAQMGVGDLDAWMKDVDNSVLADGFCGLVARTAHAQRCVKEWSTKTDEFVRRCGYGTLSMMLRDGADVPRALAKDCLGRIEREIHGSANRAREAMNTALISIGTYVDDLEEDAIAAALRIGPVDIDHGETGCKTPDAPSYIEKAAAHRKRKQGRHS